MALRPVTVLRSSNAALVLALIAAYAAGMHTFLTSSKMLSALHEQGLSYQEKAWLGSALESKIAMTIVLCRRPSARACARAAGSSL